MSRSSTLLPPFRGQAEQGLTQAVADQFPVSAPNRELWNPLTCPAELLPYLAWGLSVDYWDPLWPEDVRRAVIADSVRAHRHKGTIGAIRRALRCLGADCQIDEWWQTGGVPGTFNLTAYVRRPLYPGSDFIIDPRTHAALERAVEITKPVSRSVGFLVGVQGATEKLLGAAARVSARQSGEFHPEIVARGGSGLGRGAGLRRRMRIRRVVQFVPTFIASLSCDRAMAARARGRITQRLETTA